MPIYYADDHVTLHQGDALDVACTLSTGSAACIVTSPPYYGLRDYGVDGQYGLDASPAAYVETMRALFAELRRVLADDGTLWLNIGDSYARGNTGQGNVGGGLQGGSRPSFRSDRATCLPTRRVGTMEQKNLLGIPWRVAFALQDDGWILRNSIIWHKPNAMPESVTDRLSTRHENLFLFSRSRRYWFDLDPIREPHTMRPQRRPSGRREDVIPRPGQSRQSWSTAQRDELGVDGHPLGRNPGDVWSVPTQPFSGAHFAVMPTALAERCVQAGCKPGGAVLDPFSGSGTTGLAAARHGRRYIGIDLSAAYLADSLKTRLRQTSLIDEEAV